jgi:2-haloacid dehalogenase
MLMLGALMTVSSVSAAQEKEIPRVIVFDTFGTLVDWRSSLIRYLTEFGRERGVNADWTKLIDAWRAQYMPSLNNIRNRERPWATLDELHRASLEKLVTAHGINVLSRDDLDYIVNGWHKLTPWPDTVPGLSRLRRKFIVGPLSNANVSLLVDLAKFGGLPWDMVLGSDVFEHYKPDREIYTGIGKFFKVSDSAVMLVAAHNNDLGAAKSFGLMTAFIPRPTEYGPEQTTDLKPENNYNYVASSVEDLAQQLGA